MALATQLVRAHQGRLNALGYAAGPVDGVEGRRTRAATVAFKRRAGLRARAFVGPVTMERLWASTAPRALTVAEASKAEGIPEWAIGLHERLGQHEARDAASLSAWMRAHGNFLGDPRKLPWCGDGVESSVLQAIPGEPMPKNPFWARAYATEFGVESAYVPGAIGVIAWRAGGGHVGIIARVERDRDGNITRILLLGGNQRNAITYAWFSFKGSKGGFIAARWPKGAPRQTFASFGPETAISGGSREATR